jgi:hypothetical protein
MRTSVFGYSLGVRLDEKYIRKEKGNACLALPFKSIFQVYRCRPNAETLSLRFFFPQNVTFSSNGLYQPLGVAVL